MNILISGVGGQGVITLKKILSYASIKEGKFFCASELHGLSQRGGSVSVHFRFGPSTSLRPSAPLGLSPRDERLRLRLEEAGKIHSPLIGQGEADLIIGLDLLEAARVVDFASPNSIYLVNNYFTPFFQLSSFTKEDFLKTVSQITKNIFIIEAAKRNASIFGFVFAKQLLPFKEDSYMFGIEKSVPSKFIKENKEAFNFGKELGKKYEGK